MHSADLLIETGHEKESRVAESRVLKQAVYGGPRVLTGFEVVIIVLILTGVDYVTGSIFVTGLVISLMLFSHPGFEDSGQMGIKQK